MAKSYFFRKRNNHWHFLDRSFCRQIDRPPAIGMDANHFGVCGFFTAAVAGSLWTYRAMLGRHQRPRAVAKSFGLSTPVGFILGFPMSELIMGSFSRLWELLFGNFEGLLAFSMLVGGQLVTMFCISMMFGAIAKLFDGFKSVAPKKRH